MSDLISREDVIKLIESKLTDGHLQMNEDIPLIDANELLDDVSDLPIVYDINKVIEELENHTHGYLNLYVDGIKKAIEIIKEQLN